MPAQNRLHVVEHSNEIIAIDRGVIVTILFGEAMGQVTAPARQHELAAPAVVAKVERSVSRGFPARLKHDICYGIIEYVEGRADSLSFSHLFQYQSYAAWRDEPGPEGTLQHSVDS